MYTIFADDVCIYDDTNNMKEFRVVSPELSLADNSAGTLTMTLPPTNVGYDTVQRLKTTITVYRNNQEIWEGRVLSEQTDFYKNRKLTCEGELAYLNDTIQPQAEFENPTPESFIRAIIAEHNSHAPANRQFTVGTVTVTARMVNEDTSADYDDEDVYVYTNYGNTLSYLMDKFVNSPEDRKDLKGHFRIRKENGIRYLDFLKDYPITSSQTIEFGMNLMDFTVDYDETEFCTVLIPLGEQYEDGDVYGLEGYLDITEVNGGKNYITNAEALQTFGWIERVQHFDQIEEDTELLTKGRQFLSETQFGKMKLSATAVDLSYLNVDTEAFQLLDQIRIRSNPHGLDKLFPLTEIRIPMDNLGNTTFTLGLDPEDNRDSIASSVGSSGNSIKSIIREGERTKTRLEVLDTAIESEVTRATESEGSLSSRITQTAEGIESEVTRATTAEGTLSSRISQSAHDISLSVDNGYSTAGITITLKDEDGNIIDTGTGTINMNGVVTFSNNNYCTASEASSYASSAESNAKYYADTTTIDGGRITTGTISANRIDTDNLVAKQVQTNAGSYRAITVSNGEITFGTGAYIFSSPYTNTLTIAGASTVCLGNGSSSYSGTVTTDLLLYVGGNSTFDSRSYAGIISAGRIYSKSAIAPFTSGGTSCGVAEYKWSSVYANNATIQTSDRNEKHDIEPISEKYEQLFDKLEPVTYMRNDGDRVHIGFVAQDVKSAMDDVDISPEELSAYCRDDIEDPETGETKTYLALRYGEFVALNTHMIQKQQARIDALEAEVAELKSLVKTLIKGESR